MFDLQKVGQGHGVIFSELHQSTTKTDCKIVFRINSFQNKMRQQFKQSYLVLLLEHSDHKTMRTKPTKDKKDQCMSCHTAKCNMLRYSQL